MVDKIENDIEVMNDLDSIVNKMEDIPVKKRKPKVASSKKLERNRWIASQVDETISDGYIYSGSERQTHMAEAWRRYFRQPYGTETDGYSDYVSPIIQHQVNYAVADITEPYHSHSGPITKFRPAKEEDAKEAEDATEYISHIWNNKIDGQDKIDQLAFNALLLKSAPTRVYMKEVRSREPIEFKEEGTDKEVIEDKLAKFIVANKLEDKIPVYSVEDEEKKDGETIYHVCYKWETDTIIEKYPDVQVISPENFFISRQAESPEKAKVLAFISPVMLTQLKEEFPFAHLENGYKDSEKMAFWEQLQSDYQTWYSETTWFSKWGYDSLQFFEQYDNQNDESSGLGTKELFVVDAEIYLDPEDTGDAKLCHVIKAGNNILYKKEISERSLDVDSLIKQGNRWNGIGLWDINEQECRSDTILNRAFEDSAVQAAHPTLSYDPGVYDSDSIYNRGPDSVFEVKVGATPQPGVKPLEVISIPGPDPVVQQAIQHYKSQASENTGIGSGLETATASEISDTRIDKATSANITANSTKLRNMMSRNLSKLIGKLHKRMLNCAIKGGGTPQLLEIQDSYNEVDPVGLKPKSDFVLNVDVGINDAKEKLDRVNSILNAVSVLQGSPDPTTGETLGITAELLPTAGFELGKMMLEAHNATEAVSKIFLKPEVSEDPQVSATIQKALDEQAQQFQAQLAQVSEQAKAEAEQKANLEKLRLDAQTTNRKLDLEERRLNFEEDQAAFKAADDAVKEERYDDQKATDKALESRSLDIKEKDVDNKHTENMKKIKVDEDNISTSDHKSITMT